MNTEYQKINTLFMRDENNIIIPDMFTCPEFEYLKDLKWETTEKIDGTNIRVELYFGAQYDDEPIECRMKIKGRTEAAQLPTHLTMKLDSLFGQINWLEIFPTVIAGTTVVLYGEGYGAKIQKGGNYIKNDVGFILFDVKVNNWWLNRDACQDIASKLNIPIVPFIGYMTLPEAIEYVKAGFKSVIAENKDYDAEGLVLKTPYGLQFRNGERIITKIKTVDFRKYKNKYGDGPVEQKPNPHYNK